MCKNKYFCNVITPSENTRVLAFNEFQKHDKAPFIIYADVECILQNTDGWKNNSEYSSATKVSKHFPSGFSMSTISSFRSTKNKHGKDCMKSFCESLRSIQ